MTTTPALQLKSIKKAYGAVQVIHGIDLTIEEGEFVVFVGPSGCGKSTLLRQIAGLDEPTSGEIILRGRDVTHVPAAERGLSMVFQSYALYPHMSVRQNLSFGLENLRMDRAEIARRVDQAAKMLQIDTLLERRPGQLSGGQRQRVAIGRAIVREPVIFLFDEPLSNLDAELRLQMRVEIAQLHADLGNTMIYVTHDQVEAMTMADRIVVLNKGKIEQFGSPMELYHHPATRFVATFIGQPNMNLIPATVLGAGAEGLTVEFLGGSRVTLPVEAGKARAGDKVEVGLRPENLIVGQGLSMHLRVLERLGGTAIAYGQMADGLKLCAALPGDTAVSEGQTVDLSFSPADAHVFDAQGQVMRRQQAPALAA